MLQYMADGKSPADAAALVGYTPQTGKNMLRTARIKFDVENTYHLLATALRRGLID